MFHRSSTTDPLSLYILSPCCMTMVGSLRVVASVFFVLLILASTVQNFCAANTNVTCHEIERQALLEFKQDLSDPSGRLASWGNNLNCCDWTGVVCDNSNGHVLELRLRNPLDPYKGFYIPSEAYVKVWFGGKVNPSLLDLKHLRYLDLSGSNFGGIIPKFLSSMQSLRYLNLSAAGFGGLIPPQLGNLTNLRFLDLHDLSSLLYVENLRWLSNLVKLQHLDLSRVDLSRASDWFQVTNALPSLVELHLSGCQLDHLPPQTNFNFSSLFILDLSSNSFSNPLIPSWIFRLKSLVSLDLSHNNFEGPLPDGLRNFSSLRYLNLYWNKFNSSIPAWLYGFRSLEFLNLGSNNLHGPISNDFGNLTSVATLYLSDNELEGVVPRSMGSLCSLKKIDLSGLKLSHDLSEVLEALSSGCLSDRLESLYLDRCELSGHLTDQLLEFKILADLSLSRNSISGPIPVSLGFLASLRTLDLSRNRVNGTFPESIGQLWKMEKLWLIPEFIASSPLLGDPVYIDLNSNYFDGPLPCLSSKVNTLDLSNNSFSGPVSPLLCCKMDEPKWLEILHMADNHLSGKIPDCWMNWPNLVSIDLKNNNLSGNIPSSIGSLSLLQSLHLGKNNLSGVLPSSLQNCTKLLAIDFGENNFVGNIPAWMGERLSDIIIVSLRSNSFEGQIPDKLCALSYLAILDLAHNNLSGSIPKCFKNFSAMAATQNSSDPISYAFELLSLVVLVISCFCDAISEAACLESERQALLRFTQDLTDNSSRLASWSNGGDCCDWTGVVCDNLTGHVLELHLGNIHDPNDDVLVPGKAFERSRLSGKINTSLLDLKHLQYLDLSGNNFGGQIPGFLGSLQNLRYLNLSTAGFEGLIPPQLGNLTNLQYLDLHDLLSVFLYAENLQWLTSLAQLQHLDLSGISLSKASDWLQVTNALPSLIVLRLSYCQLDPVPPLKNVNFSSLGTLDLSYNEFSNSFIYSWIFELHSLVSLDLSLNSFQGHFPDGLRNMSSLRYLSLASNQFNSSIPNWMYGFNHLQDLDLGSNNLQGRISEDVGNLTSAISLDFGYSNLEGAALRSLGSLCSLRSLVLSGIKLSQDVSEVLESLSGCLSDGLESLFLAKCELSGILSTIPPLGYPSSIDLNSNFFEGSLPCLPSNVGTLDLSNNSFSGPISPFLCCNMEEPKNLGNLRLADNHLSGPIPDCWMNSPNLISIDFKNNNLSGSLPRSMGSLSLLQSLHLRKNNISGVLPLSLQNCSSLLALDLSENKFEGSIPSWIGEKLSKIMIVGLRANNFQGDIPHTLCALSYLTILDLAHNNLSGNIPKCFTNFSAMASKRNSSDPISYAFGHFKNSIETTLVVIKGILLEYSSTLRLVTSMDLSDNNLSGEIPVEITGLLGLRSLNLSTNLLTGRIPETIGKMGTLESVDFSFNQLSGAIPSSISNLTFLSYLNVAYNKLTGKIPLSTQLQSFDASNFAGNDLCGPPLTDNCSINAVIPGAENREKTGDGFEVDWFWFSASMALGFIIAFWSVAGPLLFKRSWRSAYFRMLDNMGEKIQGVFANNCLTQRS
ncbi:hypothetical protein SCA6_004399 [Theobroma cacao]